MRGGDVHYPAPGKLASLVCFGGNSPKLALKLLLHRCRYRQNRQSTPGGTNFLLGTIGIMEKIRRALPHTVFEEAKPREAGVGETNETQPPGDERYGGPARALQFSVFTGSATTRSGTRRKNPT
jgi:hypothetical protein